MNKTSITILPEDELNATESIYISATGYYHKPTDHKITREAGDITNEAIIIYCVKGEGWVEILGDSKIILPGNFLFCDKSTAHSYGSNPDNPWCIYWAHFGGAFVEYFATQLNLNNQVGIRSIYDSTQVIQTMDQILHLLNQGLNHLNRLASYSYLKTTLLNTIILSQNHPNSSKELSEKAIFYMKENLRLPLSLDALASHCNLSKYHFLRLFKKQTGLTPIYYFNKLKIEQSKILLLTTNKSIGEISRILNFNTAFYFSEVFKQHTSISPRDYRNKW